jgi:hypothetical protein
MGLKLSPVYAPLGNSFSRTKRELSTKKGLLSKDAGRQPLYRKSGILGFAIPARRSGWSLCGNGRGCSSRSRFPDRKLPLREGTIRRPRAKIGCDLVGRLEVAVSTSVKWAVLASIGGFAQPAAPGVRRGIRQAPGSSDRFDIDAKAGDARAREPQMRLILQTLLAERFRLTIRQETRGGRLAMPATPRPRCSGSSATFQAGIDSRLRLENMVMLALYIQFH